jgi:hypothetical protein
MNEHELTQELQRFTTRFTDRVVQAAEVLERSPNQRVRDEALRKTLGYVSSAIEIASGPYPEIDLLDMVVFVHLCRTVLDKHWIPALYEEEGYDLSDAFARAEGELNEIADRALDPARREHLANLVDGWLADNPSQVRVEGMRLSDFASGAARAAADRMLEAKGLLSSVKTATEAANAAMQLVERAMFLVHRMPSVLRLQARLAAREILGDSIAQITGGIDALRGRLGRRVRRLAKLGTPAALLGIGGMIIRQTAPRQ